MTKNIIGGQESDAGSEGRVGLLRPDQTARALEGKKQNHGRSLKASEVAEFLKGLDYQRDGRKPADNRRRGRFQAGWEDWTVRDRDYKDRALSTLTWHNLGFRFGKEFGSLTREEIREVYAIVTSFQEALSKGAGSSPDGARHESHVANGGIARNSDTALQRNSEEIASLEEELNEELLSLFRRTGRATGYWPSYFLREIRRSRGLAVAKKLLSPGGVSYGFDRLVEARRADLSVEAIATSGRFAILFTEAELSEARRRLSRLPQEAWPAPRMSPFPEEVEAVLEYAEGAVRKITVNQYERSQEARAACLRHHGTRCVVCKVDLEEPYGELGRGFIHVHHLYPLAGPGLRRRVNPKTDLVPVCPNCHAMLHRMSPPLDVEDLKRRMASG